jgi:hypothetical protein
MKSTNLPLDVCVHLFATECMDKDEAGKYGMYVNMDISSWSEGLFLSECHGKKALERGLDLPQLSETKF